MRSNSCLKLGSVTGWWVDTELGDLGTNSSGAVYYCATEEAMCPLRILVTVPAMREFQALHYYI